VEWELRRDANIGQINMLTASSFCGLYGALWGYDFVRSPSWPPPRSCSRPKNWDQFDPERRERILNGPPRVSGARLFDAAEYLFGHNNDDYRHPPLPGSMVTCANKSKSLLVPTTHTGETPAVRESDKSKVRVGK
jgi:histidine decarboxylase